ncbi:MAG: AAA family ATPase [Isosphaeraceae bacterium]
MSQEFLKIERCRISGFKSIREADITLGSFNVVIGANGAGKSNLVSYFALLHAALNERLDGYVVPNGGPNALLHLGPKHTSEIAAAHTVTTEVGTGTLYQRLEFQAPDNLVYSRNHGGGRPREFSSNELAIFGVCSVVEEGDQYHSLLRNRADRRSGEDRSNEVAADNASSSIKVGEVDPRLFLIYERLKDGIGVYHFHDTSLKSPIRLAGYIEDNRQLHTDGSNLAAVLFRLRLIDRTAYERIKGTIRLIAPFFDDFSLAPRALDPTRTRILLNWRQIGSDYEFGPHQLSDGALRAMALVTLLLQPEAELPKLVVIDEPEIGLHPYAVSVIVSLLKKASHYTQVIVATQSPQIVDESDPEEVICVERKGQESVFTRLDAGKLQEWLEEYSLGEIWRKNLIGGGPH